MARNFAYCIAGGILSMTASVSLRDDGVLEADTMVGVDGPFLAMNPIRGVRGGGLPWILDEAKVELDSDGN